MSSRRHTTRIEAGATHSGPSVLDTETCAPPDGEDRITAARFTVDQVVELPTWTDKSAATRRTLDEKSDQDNDAFDTATQHGKNTGTNINANIDEVTKVP